MPTCELLLKAKIFEHPADKQQWEGCLNVYIYACTHVRTHACRCDHTEHYLVDRYTFCTGAVVRLAKSHPDVKKLRFLLTFGDVYRPIYRACHERPR
jgi:hypothetical protein